MTMSAWVMLVFTWTVVASFAIRFFLAILRVPMEPGSDADGTET
jgi:hypothetical protein